MNRFAINLPITSLKTLASGAIAALLITACSTPPNEVNNDVCTKEGTFKSTIAFGFYYRCELKNGTFIRYVYQCPAGQEYDESLGRCKK